MAGATLDRKLTATRAGRVRFAVATQADDADIRSLLRRNPMAGEIALTLEREPDYFADARLAGEEKQTIVARENGSVVCAGSCAIRERFVNGEPRRVGYLGGLRLDARAAGRFDILRRGYEVFRELQADHPADFYFTSISADNAPARRFLERGLRGMPAYEFIGEFVTLLMPVGSRCPTQALPDHNTLDHVELLDWVNKQRRRYQFAEGWSARQWAWLSALGLRQEDICAVREGGRLSACAALWDQRAFKQTVIRGYAPRLAMARPLINAGARIFGAPRLPAVGTTLAHAFVSQLADEAQAPNALIALITELRGFAKGRGIEFLTLGFAANDPRLALLRRAFRTHEYQSRLYAVRWTGLGGSGRELDGRCLGPEAALL